MDENLNAAQENTVPHGDCEPLEKRLSDSLDVAITVDDVEELKELLQGCPPCLEFVESLKTTVKLCHEVGVTQTPAPLAPDTRNRMVAAYNRMLEKRKEGG